jgi:SPP1 family predicted phage head-tail adaptor
MIPAGERTTPATFERGTASTDDYGGETLTWAELAQVAAKVLYGTGQERRQAAQEGAQQAATVMVNYTPTLASVAAKDRVLFDGVEWDIASPPARVGLNDELHFSVVRAA